MCSGATDVRPKADQRCVCVYPIRAHSENHGAVSRNTGDRREETSCAPTRHQVGEQHARAHTPI